jgi:hypothetical protein
MKSYLKKELALLYRSKRIRYIAIFLTLYFVFFTYLQLYQFHTADKVDTFPKIMLLFYTTGMIPLLIALPGMILAQYFFSIKANYIDKIMTIPLSFKTIVNRKYFGYCILSSFVLILLIPTVFLGFVSFWELSAAFLFAIGPLLLIGFWSSIFNSKKYDLMGNIFFNWQGNTATQSTIGFFGIYIVFFIPFGLAYFFSENIALLFMSVTGVICVVFNNVFLTPLAKYYDKHILDKIEKL